MTSKSYCSPEHRRGISPRGASFLWYAIWIVTLVRGIPCGAQGFPPVLPEELKMTSDPQAPGAPAVILYREVDRDDRAPHSAKEDSYYRIKILTEEGRKWANVEIPFAKHIDEVKNIHARTIKPDGSVIEFDGKTYDKSILKARGLRVEAKTFTLPAVEPGCIVEYSYQLEGRLGSSSHWLLSEELFTKAANFHLKPYASAGFIPVSLHQSWSLPPGVAPPATAKDRSVSLQVSNIPAFQIEDFMPPPNELKFRVDFIYESGLADKDPAAYWKRIGDLRNTFTDKFIGHSKDVDEALAQTVSFGDSPEAKLRKIYARVHQVRNTSFELHKTNEEKKRENEKPIENAEEVLKRGYGNSWQIDWLFLAMLRSAGLEAYGCWISSRAEYFFNAKKMQSGELNEPAVLVKLDGKDLYFNPGSPFVPHGALGWSETGTAGWRMDKNGGGWVETPVSKSSDSLLQHVARLRLTEDGNLEGTVQVTYTGFEAIDHRDRARNEDDVARKKRLEDQLKHQIPVSAEVELTKQPEWSDPEAPFVAEYEVTIPGWASSAGKRTLIPAGVFTGIEHRLFEHADRIHNIYLDFPYEKSDDITIELPPGWQVGDVPSPQTKDSHVVSYALSVENNKNTLHLSRKIDWKFLLLDVKYYPALRKFFQDVRTGDEQQIVLQTVTPSTAQPAAN